MNPARGGRRRRVGTPGKVMVVAGLTAALALAGCSSKTAGHDSNNGQAAGNSSPTKNGSASKKANASPTASAAQISVTPSAAAHTNPLTPIVVKASKGTLQDVTVTNPKGVVVTGDFAPGKTSWTTNEVLGYGRVYKIVATAQDSKGKVTKTDTTVTTINPETAYPSVVPPPATANNIGVGMPLAVRFDKPIQDKAAVQKMLTVTSSPAQVGAWYWLSDTEVDYRPEHYWQAHSRIRLDIKDYGKDLGGGIYGDSDRTINYAVHDSWVARADGHSETMAIYKNNVKVKTMPISMGKQATPTHLGIHVISTRNREYTMDSCSYGVCHGPQHYRSKEYYAERISDDGEFVHENPNSVDAQGSTNVSHGCINLNKANAQWFYAHLGVGDVVEVMNSGGPQLPLTDRIGVWAVQWPTWQAGNANS